MQGPVFDRLSPLYAQVRSQILEDIDSGALAAGDFLPPEADLCTRFGISRITLRRAVKDLCDEGRLIRQQGRGTLVTPRPVPQALVSISGFSEALEAMGRTVGHLVLEHDEAASDAEAAAALKLGSGSRLERFLRLILVDGRPLTLETLFLDAVRFPGVSRPVAGGASFYRSLQAAHGVSPAGAERVISVGPVRQAERVPLQVAPSQPVYRICKTVLAADDSPIAFSRLVTPTHLVTYTVRS
jgi:DNA-binding GntR family transcriptional regulator